MSKITRLDQLKNEDSLYRVSGLFKKSEICRIQASVGEDNYVIFNEIGVLKFTTLTRLGLKTMIKEGTVSIMCLQRGNK